jgi:hypothetical protein
MRNILTRLMIRFYSSQIAIYMNFINAYFGTSDTTRKMSILFLQASIIDAEPRTPVRLLKKLAEALYDRNTSAVRYIFDELENVDYDARNPFQFDYDFEADYVESMLLSIEKLSGAKA